MPKVVRFSNHFSLGATQGGLDFVDIDVVGDVPVYLDPTAIRVQTGDWAEQCQDSLSTYFFELLDAIRKDDRARIADLVVPLVEPNETHLGQSRGQAQGRSLGSRKKADELIDALARSRAAKSGLLEDLEDTVLFVEGIGIDILSDITTCVIRAHLIEYTQNMCDFWEIKMETQASGPIWDTVDRRWTDGFTLLPRGPVGKLLLVPKSIVRIRPTFRTSEYYTHYLRPFFEDQELSKGIKSEFVRLVQRKKVTYMKLRLGDLDKRLGTSKPSVSRNSEQFPRAMTNYRVAKLKEVNSPIGSDEFSIQTDTPRTNLRELYEEITAIATGRPGANSYHRAIAKLLTALFHGSLGNENIEADLHSGLKRIDIRYDNVAAEGLFRWFGLHYHAATVVVKCKNYDHDLHNPELDQIAMRLSPDRGQIGLLVGRAFDNKDRFLQRCVTAARDGHGYVIALDDGDLLSLVEEAERLRFADGDVRLAYPLIRQRFDQLVGAL